MEVKQIRALLAEVNHYDVVNKGVAFIEQVESALEEYLHENESDLEMWYNLVLLNLIFLHDEDAAIKHLKFIQGRFSDDEASILICFIEDEFIGGIEKDSFNLLTNVHSADKKIEACKEFLYAKYYGQKSELLYKNHLAKAIFLNEKFVHAYLDLGHFFAEKSDEKTAKNYFAMAIRSVEKVFSVEDIKKSNHFDLHAYFDEMAFGIHCTEPKYEYLKSLLTG